MKKAFVMHLAFFKLCLKIKFKKGINELYNSVLFLGLKL